MATDGTIYRADAATVLPGLKRGDPVMPLEEYPSDAELKKLWKPVGAG